MVEKTTKRNNKGTIIGICTVILSIVIVVVLAVAVARRGESPVTGGDLFFVTDDTKYVLDYDGKTIFDPDFEHDVMKVYSVFFHSDNKITGLKTYFEFATEGDATNALEDIKTIYEESYSIYGKKIDDYIAVEGRYVALTALEEDYSVYKPEDIELQIKYNEEHKNDDEAYLEEEDDEEVVEPVNEEEPTDEPME